MFNYANTITHSDGSLMPPVSMIPELRLNDGYTDALGRVYRTNAYDGGATGSFTDTGIDIPVGSKVRARFGRINYPTSVTHGNIIGMADAQSYDEDPTVVLIGYPTNLAGFAIVGWLTDEVSKFGWFVTHKVPISMLECVTVGDGKPVQYVTQTDAWVAARTKFRADLVTGVYGVDGFINNITYQVAVTASCNPTIRDTIAKLRRADGKYNADKVSNAILRVVSAEFKCTAILHYLKQQFESAVPVHVDLYQGNMKTFTFTNDTIDWQSVADFIMDESVVFTGEPMDIKSVLGRKHGLWD